MQTDARERNAEFGRQYMCPSRTWWARSNIDCAALFPRFENQAESRYTVAHSKSKRELWGGLCAR
jgi:hypothetical protein